jgi:peptide/nickel transport system permease protein
MAVVEAPALPGPWRRLIVVGVLRSQMVRVVARRLLLAVPLLFVVSILSFVLVSLTPGNAAEVLLGPGGASAAAIKQESHQLGLDLPLYQQYWRWLVHAIHGNLGVSLLSKENIGSVITGTRATVTLTLLLGALIVTAIVGVGLGALSAIRGGALGRAVDVLSLVGYAVPSFWMGAVLITIFAVKLHVLPATGYVPLSQSPSQWFESLVMPVIALSLGPIAAVARYTREAMLDVLASEHIRMSWANGISPRSIYLRHALKNAAPRIITVLGLMVVGLLTGTVLVETVFALPGLGQLAVTSTTSHDVTMIQGIVVLFTLVVIAVNLVVDLAYTWLNPRVTTS